MRAHVLEGDEVGCIEGGHGTEGTEAPVVLSLDGDAGLPLRPLIVGSHKGGVAKASLGNRRH